MYKKFVVVFIVAFIFVSCAKKNEDIQYNKPAIFWYNKMLKQIARNQLDEADDTYTSLESEHKKSPLLASANLIIANAHMQEEEYIMANYYFDKYLKKFANKNSADYVRYLKIKSKFLAFKNQFRQQKLIDDTIKDTQAFINKYPTSIYLYLVKTIQSRLYMAQASFNNEIATLYKKLDKPKAVSLYQNKAKQSWYNVEAIQQANIPWYRNLFE